jgi:hypothetical protein
MLEFEREKNENMLTPHESILPWWSLKKLSLSFFLKAKELWLMNRMPRGIHFYVEFED